jgi:hypothetical protein
MPSPSSFCMMKPSPPKKPTAHLLLEGNAQRHAAGRAQEGVFLADQRAAQLAQVHRQDLARVGRGKGHPLLAAGLVGVDGGEQRFEVLPRDLSAYRQGNTGIDYVHRFESGQPGPARADQRADARQRNLRHGGRHAPAGHGVRPACGTLTISFANVEAYESFDPAARSTAASWCTTSTASGRPQ